MGSRPESRWTSRSRAADPAGRRQAPRLPVAAGVAAAGRGLRTGAQRRRRRRWCARSGSPSPTVSGRRSCTPRRCAGDRDLAGAGAPVEVHRPELGDRVALVVAARLDGARLDVREQLAGVGLRLGVLALVLLAQERRAARWRRGSRSRA